MSLAGIINSPSFFKKIFYVHAGIAAFLTLVGPIYWILVPVIIFDTSPLRWGGAVVQNYTMIALWLMYVAVVALLPFTFTLVRLKQARQDARK